MVTAAEASQDWASALKPFSSICTHSPIGKVIGLLMSPGRPPLLVHLASEYHVTTTPVVAEIAKTKRKIVMLFNMIFT